MHLRFTTAGESHGKALVAIVEGLPAGLPVSADWVDRDLAPPDAGLRPRRPHEDRADRDRVAGRRPRRRDPRLAGRHADPQPRLGQLGGRHGPRGADRRAPPPPGHPAPSRATPTSWACSSTTGVDARDILERASARETAARVAAGALARRLLEEFGVEIGSHVVSLGGVVAPPPGRAARAAQRGRRPVARCGCSIRSRRAGDHPPHRRRQEGRRHARRRGRGGGARRACVGPRQPRRSWDRKLDGRLAGMPHVHPRGEGGRDRARRSRRPGGPAPRCTIRSTRAGDAAGSAALPAIPRGGFRRRTNNAGGLEGGMTTGEPLVVRVAMKPISTLMSPLPTVDLTDGRARPTRRASAPT